MIKSCSRERKKVQLLLGIESESKTVYWVTFVLQRLPESYTSNDPWTAEGVHVTEVAVLLLLGSISVFTPSLCGDLPVLAAGWFWFLTLGSNSGLNLGSNAGLWVG